jgi:hypothetical protein
MAWTPTTSYLCQQWHAQHDRWPETHDMRSDTLPSFTTVQRLGFPTLAAVRRAAGAEDGGPEGHGGARPHGGWPQGQPRPPWGRTQRQAHAHQQKDNTDAL